MFSDNAITQVGGDYTGNADETIDGADLMVMPGLVDIHSHPSTEPFFRGVREEHGLPSMYMSGLYERGFVFRPDEPGQQSGDEQPDPALSQGIEGDGAAAAAFLRHPLFLLAAPDLGHRQPQVAVPVEGVPREV